MYGESHYGEIRVTHIVLCLATFSERELMQNNKSLRLVYPIVVLLLSIVKTGILVGML